jgi:hypothetical protein
MSRFTIYRRRVACFSQLPQQKTFRGGNIMTALVFVSILLLAAIMNSYCGHQKSTSKSYEFPGWACASNIGFGILAGIPGVGILTENLGLIKNSGGGYLTGLLIYSVLMAIAFQIGKIFGKATLPQPKPEDSPKEATT